MSIPFALEQFLELIRNYNLAIWPMQVIAYLLGIAALFLALKKTKYSSRIIAAILAFFWLWVGILCNLMYFSQIWKVFIVFGILFIIQGILFLIAGVFKSNVSFRFRLDAYSNTGSLFIIYAIAGYPILGYFFGRIYPQSLSFGLVPCPTTVFTFGMLLWADKKLPKYILIIPLIFSLSGFLAIPLGIFEDIGLIIAGLLGTFMIIYRDRKRRD